MKRIILLTGKTGQVGSALLRLLPEIGEVVAPDRYELELLDTNNIRRMVREIRPELIVNAAAYTAVDAAETQEADAYAINAGAPAVLAEEAKKIGAAIVHYSTDYVFDGSKGAPYEETDLVAPINIYGKTKLVGEQAIGTSGVPHLIFRLAWVYGTRGRNFLLTILRLATEREELRIVRDQFGAPTWSKGNCRSDREDSSPTHKTKQSSVGIHYRRLAESIISRRRVRQLGMTLPVRSWMRPFTSRPRSLGLPKPPVDDR